MLIERVGVVEITGRVYKQGRDFQLRVQLRTDHVLSEAQEEPTKETEMKLEVGGKLYSSRSKDEERRFFQEDS